MTTVIEHTEGHYEVQRTSYGEAYVWCPECVVVECDRGELGSSEGALHPWEAEYQEWRKKQDAFLRSESHDWLEWRLIE